MNILTIEQLDKLDLSDLCDFIENYAIFIKVIPCEDRQYSSLAPLASEEQKECYNNAVKMYNEKAKSCIFRLIVKK
jgi:hypothetical protein